MRGALSLRSCPVQAQSRETLRRAPTPRSAPLVSPGPSPLPSTRFSRSAFLASLRTHGSPLALRSSAPSLSQPGSTATERLYARFLDSDNFAAWADKRVRDTGGEVRRRYVRVLEREDWDEWARGRDEREVEEMVQRLEREVVVRLCVSLGCSPTALS